MTKLFAVIMLFCFCAAFGATKEKLDPTKPVYQKKWGGIVIAWPAGHVDEVELPDVPPPPPDTDDPARQLIKTMGGWAVYVAIAGFLGMLLAAYLAYRASAWWDDCAVASIIAFCGGSALAYNFKWFVIVATGCSVGFLLYVIYTAIQKKRLASARDQAMDTVDVVKRLPEWNDEAKKAVDAMQGDSFKKQLTKSIRARTEDRKYKIQKALTCALNPTKVQNS